MAAPAISRHRLNYDCLVHFLNIMLKTSAISSAQKKSVKKIVSASNWRRLGIGHSVFLIGANRHTVGWTIGRRDKGIYYIDGRLLENILLERPNVPSKHQTQVCVRDHILADMLIAPVRAGLAYYV